MDIINLKPGIDSDVLGLLAKVAFDDLLRGGTAMPIGDVADLSAGARWIPSEVTTARRCGERVEFVTQCGPCCWFWLFPNGDRLFHVDPSERTRIAGQKGLIPDSAVDGRPVYEDVGECPWCGNPHTNGGWVRCR